ncbi:hypothetical protein [Olivibacter domesticus]|uniref:hypothetical protein n=1 Tax=Olivibacter domesticus TaxID=407022 RepID=UPI0011145AFF|nr:hypothetical protein [Olivibacter domesticus]
MWRKQSAAKHAHNLFFSKAYEIRVKDKRSVALCTGVVPFTTGHVGHGLQRNKPAKAPCSTWVLPSGMLN